MKKLIAFAVVSMWLVGCSGSQSEQLTIGLDRNVAVETSGNIVTVNSLYAKARDPELYFYLPESVNPSSQQRIDIADGSLVVMGHEFTGLWCFVAQDADGRWYMQILRNNGPLCMSVGADVVLNSFSVDVR